VSPRQWTRGLGKAKSEAPEVLRIAKFGSNAPWNRVESAESGKIHAKVKAKALSDVESQCKVGSGRCRRRPGVPFGEGYAPYQPTEKKSAMT